ncbi:MAG: hypothetical protein CL609_14755 [Anaerolineaceae bacterium]|nr:hypothetical protein [Anaerolineaceae bacterium]
MSDEQKPYFDEKPPENQQPQTPPQAEIKVSLPAKKPLVTNAILGITIVIFVIQLLTQRFMGIDLPFVYLGKINQFILQGQLWRFFTPMFVHGDILHIAFNMYALYIFGRNLEYQYGHFRFFMLYVVSAFAGNVVSFVLTPNPSLGASTAIFGLLAAQAVFIFRNKRFFGKRGQSILMNTVLILVVNLVLGLSPQIDNWGHLGGLLGGAVFAWAAGPLWKINPQLGGFKVEDQQPASNTIVASIIVIVAFATLALVRWI